MKGTWINLIILCAAIWAATQIYSVTKGVATGISKTLAHVMESEGMK